MSYPMFKQSRRLAPAIAIVLGLIGCGPDDTSSSSIPVITTPTPTPSTAASSGTISTASVDCPYSGSYVGSYSGAGTLTANWGWTCDTAKRYLTGNGLPNHDVGTFPNPGNPNTISVQSVNTSMTLTPALSSSQTSVGGPSGHFFYALNSVKFDAGTGGTCASTITNTSQCGLGPGSGGSWNIEALGQSTFDFGTDQNNAHVQPDGVYHYHGMPEGLLNNAGASDAARKMVLAGWAADGFPVYARYCYTDAKDASSALKVCIGSYQLKSTPDGSRPAVSLVPMGAFLQDWTYSAGSGDLDECNGRTGATPEFPDGIYYYMATDSYPYFSRCLKGVVN